MSYNYPTVVAPPEHLTGYRRRRAVLEETTLRRQVFVLQEERDALRRVYSHQRLMRSVDGRIQAHQTRVRLEHVHSACIEAEARLASVRRQLAA
jgi:hypothetical protein